MLLASCSLQASPGPRCSASWPVWTRRAVAVAFARLVFLVLHLALCSGVWFLEEFHTFLRVRHDALHTVSLFDMWSMSLLCGSCSFHRCFSLVSALAQSRRLPGPFCTSLSAIRACFGICMDLADPVLEREVQLDFRVHSSSCGAHCGVVHSPFEWLDHRCHCNCRYLVLFVGRLPLLRGCLRRDVVWWWIFQLLMVLTILFGTV